MGTKAMQTLRHTLRAFRSDRRGNIAVIFGLALLPLIGALGAAVDYSRASATRTAMQAALDSTALMLSKESTTLSSSELQTKARAIFNELFKRKDATADITELPQITPTETGGFQLKLSASGSVDSSFTRVFKGENSITLKVNSEVVWGLKRLELALALDNTGSMAQSAKMSNLKTAAHTLLRTLKDTSKKPGDIKVAIIPFDTSVKIGTAYKDQPWFDYDSITCGSSGGWGSGWGGGGWGGSGGSSCTSTTWKNYWEGCVRDRAQPYDVQDTAPDSAVAATLYPAHDCGTLATAMPLSSDWTALNSKIDAMEPNGNTNVTIGLAWAWAALTSNAPYMEAAVPATDLDKVIIILTDGDNTESWDNINNRTVTTETAINARTAAVCSNIRSAAIKVYAIRVINGNASLLQSCATRPDMYYDVQQASQLDVVFAAIAKQLSNLRIAK
jgi:Flp pilus assembly protein TadG